MAKVIKTVKTTTTRTHKNAGPIRKCPRCGGDGVVGNGKKKTK